MRNIAPSPLRQPIDAVGFGAFVRAKAQLDVAPGRANAVRAELGLPDEARWKSVEAGWLRRIDDEPPVKRAYHLCYAQEVEALRGQAPQVEAPAEVMAPATPALELPSFMKQEQRATPEPSTDETAMLPAMAFVDEVGLPFQPAAAPAPPSPAVRPSQLEAFSALTAPTPEILDRYGVGSPAVLVALSAAFERRFDEDPALRAQFEERKAHFRSFMKPLL